MKTLFIIFWMVSIVAFFVATKMKGRFTAALDVAATTAILAFIAAFAAAITTFITTFTTTFTTTFVFVFAATFAAAASYYLFVDPEKGIPKGIRIVFYSLMVLVAGLMYYHCLFDL